MANFDLNRILKGFDYTGEFLEKSDLIDLLNQVDLNSTDDLKSYLNDEDGNYISDKISELSDSKVDIYYHNLRIWAVDNYNYIDDAMDEYGVPAKFDFHQAIQSGQYYAYSNEFYALITEFKDYIEEIDSEEEEA